MSDKHDAIFKRAKQGSMDNNGFFRCPFEDYVLCNAESYKRCEKCNCKKEDDQENE